MERAVVEREQAVARVDKERELAVQRATKERERLIVLKEDQLAKLIREHEQEKKFMEDEAERYEELGKARLAAEREKADKAMNAMTKLQQESEKEHKQALANQAAEHAEA